MFRVTGRFSAVGQSFGSLAVRGRGDAMRRFLIVAGALAAGVALMLAAVPSVAAAHSVYMECDRPSSPSYPALFAAPSSCNLGLGASYYDVQPVPGTTFYMLGL